MSTRVTIVCLMLSACGGCADSWLLYPSTQSIEARWSDRRLFRYNDREVEVFVARSPGVTATLSPQVFCLEFVGNSMRAEQVGQQDQMLWGSRPVETWAVNYPGFGGSDGPASLGFIPGTALAAYDRLKTVAGNRPIILKGFSLGTTAALYVAAHRPCAGVILQSPPPLQREILQEYGWWNLWIVASITALEVPGELNSLTTAPKATVPAVFIISGQDTIVPSKYQMMVFNNYAGLKHCLTREDAEHNTPLDMDDPALQQELDWLLAQRQAQTPEHSPNLPAVISIPR